MTHSMTVATLREQAYERAGEARYKWAIAQAGGDGMLAGLAAMYEAYDAMVEAFELLATASSAAAAERLAERQPS